MPAPKELQEQRLEICRGCSEFRQLLSRCGKCNCIMPVKVKLRGAKCPLDKWPPVISMIDERQQIQREII